MKKEEIKRDKNGRFVKKSVESKANTAKSKKADGSVKIFVECKKGLGKDEYIKELEQRCDMFQTLAERFASDYLNKCAECANLRKRYEKLENLRLVALDGLREAARQNDWLHTHLGFFKKIIYRRDLRAMDEIIYRLVEKAEGLDKD